MILIYDCEVIRGIMPKGIRFLNMDDPFKFVDGFEYVQSWSDYQNLGVSVIGCYVEGTPNSFINPDNSIPYGFPEFFQLLEQKPTVIGFNTKSFDDKLLKANKIKIKTDYDLLEEIRLAAYGSTKWDKQPKGHTYTL